MNTANLGRLEKVDLRKAWMSEATDFTPWLAHAGNMKLLGEAIGIELACEAKEKPVGPFRADILCKDAATDSWVLIENQLERTDHNHLGQLLTYAAGLEAVTIVWIAARFTEEHRAALDWLNERTDEHINFFGLEVELWRIGNSPVAPKFNVICKPNGWSRSIRKAAEGSLSEAKELQLRFWTKFVEFLEDAESSLKCAPLGPKHWLSISIGRAGFHLNVIASTWNSETNSYTPEIRAELDIRHENAKRHFAALESKRSDIEAQLGFPLVWYNPTDAAKCRIYARKDADIFDEKNWLSQFRWLKEHLEALHRAFGPLVKEL
jgi:hypothetical protein